MTEKPTEKALYEKVSDLAWKVFEIKEKAQEAHEKMEKAENLAREAYEKLSMARESYDLVYRLTWDVYEKAKDLSWEVKKAGESGA